MKQLISRTLLQAGILAALAVQVATECRDNHFACGTRVSNKQCQTDPVTMMAECPYSCQNPCVCNVTTDDTACDCKARAYRGECSTNVNDTASLCPTTCFNTTYENCSPLPAPQDANAVLSATQTQYLSLVEEQCKTGYRASVIIDKGRKICVENGVWLHDSFYGKPISCILIDCKQPPTVANANVSVNGTLFKDKAIYTCLPGYQLTAGSLTLTCGTYSWSGSQPTCSAITCPTLPEVPNTAVLYNGMTVNSTVVYSCLPGSNYINGSLQRTCNMTGNWTGSPPYCKLIECPRPPDPDHVQVNYTGINYSDKASFACMPGYSHVAGNLSRSCQQTGTWSGTLPTCTAVDCGIPSQGVHASSVVSGTTYGANVTYSCDVGYRLTSGNVTRRCQANSTWSGTPAQCQLVDCGHPGSVVNADVDVTNTTYNSSATYTCHLGYRLKAGNVTKVCTANGTWTTAEPICELMNCGEPPSVANADLLKSGTTYGSNVTFQCIVGYRHTAGDLFRTCAADGSWTGVTPTCTVKDCGQPEQGVHATSNVTATTYGGYVTYTCDVGFRLASGNVTRQCQADETWSGDPVTCQPVDCGEPGSVDNADVDVTSTTYSNSATYTCRLGYRIVSGGINKTCTASGNWSLAEPVCELVDCGEPPPVDNANAVKSGTTFGSNSTFTCILGYRLTDGDLFRTCAADGLWTGVTPTCAIVDCGRPPYVSHADVTVAATTYGSDVIHACHTGYRHASGDLVRTCQADGRWLGSTPVCQMVDCGDPGSAANADVDVTSTTYGSSATYKCRLGYRLVSGETTKTCTASGDWSFAEPVCEMVDCGEPPPVDNAVTLMSSTTYGSNVTCGCILGYRHTGGDLFRTCAADGSWTGMTPTCKIVDCGRPPYVSHADVTLGATTYGSDVIHACHTGYRHASGDLVRTCQADGRWLGTTPVCQIKDCGTPPRVEFARASYSATVYQSEVTYACNIGYRPLVAGNFSGRCLASGTWQVLVPNCTIVECGEPPVEKGAHANVTGVQYGDRVCYECFYPEDGQGDTTQVWTRTCGPDGAWLGDRPKCNELGRKRKSFSPPPREAAGAVGVGLIAIGVVSAVAALIFALDIITFRRHFLYMKENLSDWRNRWRARIARMRRRGRASHVVDPDVQGSSSKMEQNDNEIENEDENRSQVASGSKVDVSIA